MSGTDCPKALEEKPLGFVDGQNSDTRAITPELDDAICINTRYRLQAVHTVACGEIQATARRAAGGLEANIPHAVRYWRAESRPKAATACAPA